MIIMTARLEKVNTMLKDIAKESFDDPNAPELI